MDGGSCFPPACDLSQAWAGDHAGLSHNLRFGSIGCIRAKHSLMRKVSQQSGPTALVEAVGAGDVAILQRQAGL